MLSWVNHPDTPGGHRRLYNLNIDDRTYNLTLHFEKSYDPGRPTIPFIGFYYPVYSKHVGVYLGGPSVIYVFRKSPTLPPPALTILASTER